MHFFTVAAFAAGLAVALCVPLHATEIIAHRGASADAPENTLAAVKLGWAQKADCVEIDVHLTKDGRVIVSHDATTKRTTGVDLTISQTESAELRKLDAGSFKGARYRGEKMPFVEEVLATVPLNKMLFIEIKCGPEILPPLKKAIDESGKAKNCTIIGFGLDTMAAARKTFPDMPVYYLRSRPKDPATNTAKPYSSSLIRSAKERNLSGLNLHYDGITEAYVRKVKDAGLNIYAWTVDDMNEAIRLQRIGVQGVTTNKPGAVGEALRPMQAE